MYQNIFAFQKTSLYTQRSSYRVTPSRFLRLPRPSSRFTSKVAETLQAELQKPTVLAPCKDLLPLSLTLNSLLTDLNECIQEVVSLICNFISVVLANPVNFSFLSPSHHDMLHRPCTEQEMCWQFTVALNSMVRNIDILPPSLLKLCQVLEEKSSIIPLAEAIRNSLKPLSRASLLVENERLNKLVEDLTIENKRVQSKLHEYQNLVNQLSAEKQAIRRALDHAQRQFSTAVSVRLAQMPLPRAPNISDPARSRSLSPPATIRSTSLPPNMDHYSRTWEPTLTN